jgi:threonine aldolase
MMWVSKVPNYDAYGLFRALHSHNPPHYSHIVGLSSHFYAHIGGGSQGLSSTYEQAHVDLDLLTLAS